MAEKAVGLAGCLVNIWCESRSSAWPVSHSQLLLSQQRASRAPHIASDFWALKDYLSLPCSVSLFYTRELIITFLPAVGSR